MYKTLTPGPDVPDEFNVVIEIPAHSEPVKYEIDKDSGALFVDRFMTAAMRYPCDYGYVPGTLSEDGDAVDVLVISPVPLISGCLITVRPIGMLRMVDEAGKDFKILAVPTDKLTPFYRNIQEPSDLFPLVLEQIAHFFKHYKDLDEGKWVSIEGWEGPDAAKAEVLCCIDRYQSQSPAAQELALH